VSSYVHGYESRENRRLRDQASALTELLHRDTAYSESAAVIEVGCGVGAQTIPLASNSPGARITAVDVSAASLVQARIATLAAGIGNVTFREADVFHLPFDSGSFDHAFLCFVLEHLDRPIEALQAVMRVVKPGGTVTVVEGDHGSTFFSPESEFANDAIACLVELQRRAGGNALIGRTLYPLLVDAGFERVRVSPRQVYVDSSRPDLIDGFTKRTFTAMVEGVRDAAIGSGLIEAAAFDRGIEDLYATAKPGGTFSYTFFKAFAVVPEK
jgi:SAM-dependent methyltransferase